METLTILYLGTDWWGSDDRALAQAIRKSGHQLITVNYENFYPLHWSSFTLRVARRILRKSIQQNYNQEVKALIQSTSIDFILVFKGMLLEADTVRLSKERNIPIYCFYPDVSFSEHDANITECLPLYDHVFTTKPFHTKSEIFQSMTSKLHLVRHGFDPEVHRPISLGKNNFYDCDVSFVGCWSPKKEATLAAIASSLPEIKLSIWGAGWQHAKPSIQQHWKQRCAYGDELAIIYQASKINLGLLSGAGKDTNEGDQITARSWQIPATNSFLLHEDTKEFRTYYPITQTASVFKNENELIEKIRYYLANNEERKQIAKAGHQHTKDQDYTYEEAAQRIIDLHQSNS